MIIMICNVEYYNDDDECKNNYDDNDEIFIF